MRLIEKLENKFGRYAIHNLSLTLVIGQVIVYLLISMGMIQRGWIAFQPAAILHGGGWQLFTFLFLPPIAHPIFLIFAWYIFYIMGVALESYWGEFRFNLYVLIGAVATVAAGFIYPSYYVTNSFLFGSVFLAFAFLNPNFELLLFFILPVKIKWLALLTWLGYGYVMIMGPWQGRLLVLASIINFLIFFATDIRLRIRSGKWQMEQRAQKIAESKTPFHSCATCGRTDKSDPGLQFFYTREGDKTLCFCEEHVPGREETADEN